MVRVKLSVMTPIAYDNEYLITSFGCGVFKLEKVTGDKINPWDCIDILKSIDFSPQECFIDSTDETISYVMCEVGQIPSPKELELLKQNFESFQRTLLNSNSKSSEGALLRFAILTAFLKLENSNQRESCPS